MARVVAQAFAPPLDTILFARRRPHGRGVGSPPRPGASPLWTPRNLPAQDA